MAQIFLKDAGKAKIKVAKLVMIVTDFELGAKASKELVDKTSTSTEPVLITSGLDAETAIKFKAKFKKAGATVVTKEEYEDEIIKLLIEQNKKLSVSDINTLLKTKDIDGIKESCENLYNNGDIDFAGQGRYYIFSEDNKKTKSKSGNNSTLKSEIKVLLDLFKKDILTKEQFVAQIEEKLN
tara:strand:- start:42 stop:587 length:546 start_codon:yes stop_codon:yes gene_type:complete